MINKELKSEVEKFAFRVLKGKAVTPQETAILPDILNFLNNVQTETNSKVVINIGDK